MQRGGGQNILIKDLGKFLNAVVVGLAKSIAMTKLRFSTFFIINLIF